MHTWERKASWAAWLMLGVSGLALASCSAARSADTHSARAPQAPVQDDTVDTDGGDKP